MNTEQSEIRLNSLLETVDELSGTSMNELCCQEAKDGKEYFIPEECIESTKRLLTYMQKEKPKYFECIESVDLSLFCFEISFKDGSELKVTRDGEICVQRFVKDKIVPEESALNTSIKKDCEDWLLDDFLIAFFDAKEEIKEESELEEKIDSSYEGLMKQIDECSKESMANLIMNHPENAENCFVSKKCIESMKRLVTFIHEKEPKLFKQTSHVDIGLFKLGLFFSNGVIHSLDEGQFWIECTMNGNMVVGGEEADAKIMGDCTNEELQKFIDTFCSC